MTKGPLHINRKIKSHKGMHIDLSFLFQHWLRATSNPNNLKGDKLLINVNNIYLPYFNFGNACNTWFKLLYLGNLNFRVL